MRHGVRRALAASLGVVLLLGVGAGPATAANDAEDKITLDIGDQPLGQHYCDRAPGDAGFYSGKSASKTYDERFSRVGPAQNMVPNLGTSKNPGWTPQGLGYWPNWKGTGKGPDLLLVGAYKEGEYALIHGMEADSGMYVGSVRVKATHLGGIVVHGSTMYISNKGSKSLRRYYLPDLRHRFNEQPDGHPYSNPDDYPSVDSRGDPLKVTFGVAFLGIKGSVLYAGAYVNDDYSETVMESFLITNNGLRKLEAYAFPVGTQGMTITNDGKFVFSASPTHWDEYNREERGRRSFIYVVSKEDMKENLYLGEVNAYNKTTECFRAPSMSEGMATYGDKTYLAFESGAGQYQNDPDKPDDEENPPENEVLNLHVGRLGSEDGGGPGGPGQGNTKLSYTGPATADFHDAFSPSARLVGPSGPVSGAKVSFTLGRARSGDSCTATTDSSGVGKCSLTPSLRPGTYTMTMRFGGGDGLDPATETVTFTVTKQETALRYTGPKRVANGTPAQLSGRLTEEDTDGAPVSGRKVSLALGRGDDRQECSGETNGDGEATCTIDKVDQPLNDDATVPVGLDFDGDDFYKSSAERTKVLLEYYTGRSFGVSADVNVAGLGAGVEPTPDTGKVRTARASTHDPGCTASLGVLPLLRTGTLCPKLVTSLAPGTSRATAAVQDARIGLPGLPLIEVEAATARSTSTCEAEGSAKGSTDVRLRVGGRLVEVTGEVNAEIDLPGTARLVVNEQRPVPGAEHGRTVNAVHLTAAGGAADVVIASATSDVHNCA